MFRLLKKSCKARAGELHAAHGIIKTPFFMPVATKGAVKFLDFEELKEIGGTCIISNSLLLSQRPGTELIKKAGGLHKFYNWDKGIFTDSGGFQSGDEFFLQKTTDEGAYFKSPYDGKTELITPERAMEIQLALGSDFAMCLDDMPKADDDKQTVKSKTLRTHSWAKRCKEYHDKHKNDQLLFGIAQGGTDKELREKSAKFISTLNFDGYALGGLAIGEPTKDMLETIRHAAPLLPEDKPRYVMGVGSPADILECIGYGIDCFDSTFPTMNARHNTLFTWQGKLRIDRVEFRDDLTPIDPTCQCRTCKEYSRAYIHHVLRVDEAVGKKLATIHNLAFMMRLLQESRNAIEQGRWDGFKDDILNRITQAAHARA
jgi:queuine tRNA-ribosyltransferase